MFKIIKYILTFVLVLVFRLLPFRAPNVEPIMATLMPIGKINGSLISFLFGFLSIMIFDLITSGIGVWTFITSISYGFIGFFAFYYFKNRSGWKSYAKYAFLSTIIYDVVTGLTIGPLFFGQTFTVALLGQIPFTVLHLIGNVSFAIVLSPVIEAWMIKESKVEVMLKKLVLR